MIPFIDLKLQYAEIKEEVGEKIKDVMESGQYILGENVSEFEKEFAKYCGTRYAVGVASGTDAIQLSLVAHGIKGEVITVANTASATGTAILLAGAKPVFVDVGKDMNKDTEKIEAAITEKTQAVMPVHLYGNPCQMKEIMDIASRHRLTIIEDACQAHGAEYKGKKMGSFGTGCFSFYPTKNLGAFGDGGVITTNDGELAEKLKQLREYGWKQRYDSSFLGFNSRLDEIQAAVLRIKLKKLDRWNEERRKIAKIYSQSLNVTIPKENGKHVYHLYVIRSGKRDELRKKFSSADIQTLIHYPKPLHMQAAFPKAFLPETEKYAKEILSLPMFIGMNEEDAKKVCRIING